MPPCKIDPEFFNSIDGVRRYSAGTPACMEQQKAIDGRYLSRSDLPARLDCLLCLMTQPPDPLVLSGIAHEEQSADELSSSRPDSGDQMDIALEDRVLRGTREPMLKTELPHLALSMFASGGSIRVRVGNPQAPSELYECVYESADEANTAMLDSGILREEQIADMAEPAGVGIELATLTAQQLEAAGLKRHGGGNL